MYKGSCREGGGSVLLSVKVTWRSREALEGSQQCRVQQCTHSAGLTTSLPSCFRPNSWEHRTTFCSLQAAAVNIHSGSSAASSFGYCLCCNLCLLVSSLCGLEVEVPPLELCVRLNSAARLGSRSVQSPLESSTIMTHYNLHLRIGRRGTVWYCLVLSWIRAVLDGIGWY